MEPIEIHFLDMPASDAIEAKIRQRAAGLYRLSDSIQKCQVWIASPHGHHRKGSLYGLRIRLTVPGEEIAVRRQPAESDIYVAIRESFDAVRRDLEDYERRRRGKVKSHPRAKIDRTARRRIPSRRDPEGTDRSKRPARPSK